MSSTHCKIKYQKRCMLILFVLTVPGFLWYMKIPDVIKQMAISVQLIIRKLYLIDFSNATLCKTIQFPIKNVRNEEMQSIDSIKSTLVYSAYHDVDEPTVIKVIAICYKHTVLPYYCQVWYSENGGDMKMVITNATFRYLADAVSIREFTPCYIFSTLPIKRAPSAVSVVLHQNCSTAKSLMNIVQIKTKIYKRNFTMCLSALHGHFDGSRKLVEWIEFNKILGANLFYIYEFSSGNNVQKVLNHYTKQGLVDVIKWPLPMFLFQTNMHYFAQSSAYNDCLLRSKSHSKYVVVTDLDEFLIPHVEGTKTWTDMLKHLPEADSFIFRNCFFPLSRGYSDLTYPEKVTAQKYSIVSLLVLKRDSTIWPAPRRSKYIARTSTTNCLLTHHQFGGRNYTVDPAIGISHHYSRAVAFGKRVVIDKTVLIKYGRDIANSVARAWEEIDNV